MNYLKISKIEQENDQVKTFYFDFELNSKPGQFVMLWVPEIDQKPFSVAYDNGKTFGLTVFKRGPLTEKLFEMNVGDRVGISGPYGTWFSLKPHTHYIMVAGGYGAAPLGFLAERLTEEYGVTVDFCIGSRNKDLLLFEERISKIPNTFLHIATDDGSEGHHGYVTDILSQVIEKRKDAKDLLQNRDVIVCTCGPELMEKKVLDICNEKDVNCEVSIERYMKCGVGICGQCVVDDLGICMCKEGPVVPKYIANKIKEFGNYHREKSGAKTYLKSPSVKTETKTTTMDTEQLILKLHEINAVKFGEFKLKTGSLSPIYIDLRVTVSYPEVLKSIAQIMWQKISHLNFDIIAGVPYTALPIATAMSLEHNKPMVMRRKEVKDYGTRKAIEGAFTPGQTCLVVEDLITSGSSVFETIDPLKHEGLNVKDVVVLLDREQGGKENISQRGCVAHPIFTMSELLEVLKKHNRINQDMYDEVRNYINNTQVRPLVSTQPMQSQTQNLTYGARAQQCTNPTAKKLLSIMEEKKTNLAIAADVTTKKELLEIADRLGSEICVLKTHIDIVEDFDQNLVHELMRLAQTRNFLLFEDRKFADIGNTVKHQYENGIYHISDWADIVNAHTVPGPGIITGLKEVGMQKGRGLLLLAEMSPEGNLATGEYTEKSLKMAEDNKDFVVGFITMKKLLDDPSFINMTPGVKLVSGGDGMGQQYNTPQRVIKDQESDIIIVGRGIYQAEDSLTEAKKYREAGWKAYQERL
ncbi:dihydroorotate dehydrogenase electron transfer subunit [Candidatus Parcubacteria bacterium]|nr:dihydroorotate dehydrogenase electron transfer subunit [Candidatus Parcubacteria bacterium]